MVHLFMNVPGVHIEGGDPVDSSTTQVVLNSKKMNGQVRTEPRRRKPDKIVFLVT